MKLTSSSILLIKASEISHMAASRQFDRFGIVRDEHYLLFCYDAPEDFMSQISIKKEPQLVFSSHLEFGVFDSVGLARKIKSINPNAIVLTLTSSEVRRKEHDELDGVIRNSFENADIPHLVAKAFLAGKSRAEIVAMIR